MTPINATVGVDLGQASDFTAIVVTERLERITGPRADDLIGGGGTELEDVYVVRHIERAALGTPYPAQVRQVGRLLAAPELVDAELVVDATGVGRPVVDLFTEAYRRGECGNYYPRPLTITSGNEAHGWNVPKRLLVSKVVALAQTGRLLFADGLPLAEVAKHELRSFSVKVSSSGNDTYEALRERDHDDIVLAVAMSVWHRNWRTVPRGMTRDGTVIDRTTTSR
ncbi:MAG TPA: hypothetical protein VM262_14325 [Acidimicrobiales bacterium]|nr:hypothetical protein [Acidimicrobiales bacterium]